MSVIKVTITGDKHWIQRTGNLGRNMDSLVVKPALRELSGKLQRTLTELFKPQSGGNISGKMYAHGYTGEYLGGLQYRLDDSSLSVVATRPQHGQNIMHGVGPTTRFNENGSPMISGDVVEWAIKKLAVPEDDAFAIAKSVAAHGTGRKTGKSPLVPEHPSGSSFFQFPEWIVKEKNKNDLQEAANRIGKITVEYLK